VLSAFVPEVVQDTAGTTSGEDVLTRRCSKQTSMVWDMSSQRRRLSAPLLLATFHNISRRGRSVLRCRGRGRSECLTLCQSNEVAIKQDPIFDAPSLSSCKRAFIVSRSTSALAKAS
jgi:hypothetical protein